MTDFNFQLIHHFYSSISQKGLKTGVILVFVSIFHTYGRDQLILSSRLPKLIRATFPFHEVMR